LVKFLAFAAERTVDEKNPMPETARPANLPAAGPGDKNGPAPRPSAGSPVPPPGRHASSPTGRGAWLPYLRCPLRTRWASFQGRGRFSAELGRKISQQPE
jgi:hypothetical protein